MIASELDKKKEDYYTVNMETIRRAIQIVKGESALARLVGVSPQAVNLWKSGSTQLLARHAARIERATAGAVTAREIGDECATLADRLPHDSPQKTRLAAGLRRRASTRRLIMTD